MAYIKREARDNFTKWSRVLLYCNEAGADKSLAKIICADLFNEARILSAATGLPVDTTRSGMLSGVAAALNRTLVVEASLLTTGTDNGGPVGASLRLAAYTRTVALIRVSIGSEASDTMTRRGDLVMWERAAVGASTSTIAELGAKMSDGLQQMLKALLTEILEARRLRP
ncbi:MAG: hypothetical protein IPJ11_10850 [Gemmatimonadetes bacterium]|nr:hypothetical protein [Gemmatimonadota bacterium]